MTTRVRGADILTSTLACLGARYLFSLSGNHVMPIYDAALDAKLDIIHVRHEGAAVHMADAWGRLTGMPGIALVTGGPGHANAIGALYTARESDSPLVLLSGHAPLNQLGMDAFQEMRQADLAAPVVKASWTAQRAETVGQDIVRAWQIALSGRPGPVHVSLPSDVLEAVVSNSDRFEVTPSDPPRTGLDVSIAEAATAKLASARRPIILTGPVLSAHRGERLRAELAQACGVPVVGMESPRGVNDPALGAIAEVLREADLVLLLAKRLDFTLRFGRPPAFDAACEFIQIDPDQESFARARSARADASRMVMTAVADPVPAAEQLIAAARPRTDQRWRSDVDAAVRYRPSAWDGLSDRSRGPLHPVEVGRTVQAMTDPEAVLVMDGGEFGQWAQACVGSKHRLINGPAGSIGSAIPFALAAKLAHPTAKVVALLGDGTFGFHMAEFDTAVRHNLPFVAVVGNDACWNAEHQIQLNAYGRERAVGCELLPSRYERAVEGLGGVGAFVETSAQLRPALKRALAADKPACVNVLIERLAAPNITRA